MTMNTVAARMDDTLRNAFMVEMKDLFARDMIFEKLRPARAGGQPVLVVCNRMALRSGHHIIIASGFLMVCASVGEFEVVGHGPVLNILTSRHETLTKRYCFRKLLNYFGILAYLSNVIQRVSEQTTTPDSNSK